MIIVVMGVSGSGKTTVGRALSERIGGAFIEGDDLHPDANKRKMASGQPLTDDDRWGWLDRVRAEMERLMASGRDAVVACSALKRRYRDVLAHEGDPVVFAYLRVDRAIVRERVEQRRGSHFMPASLLDSQYEALEEPGPDEPALTVEVDHRGADALAEAIARRLDGRRPGG